MQIRFADARMMLAILLLANSSACSRAKPHAPRVIVLGIDGMDPGFLERHWNRLPNLARLRDQGGFRRLATTMPAQSPVAWSSFITGLGPDGHGIYDFLHRDPATRMPRTSMSEIRPGRRLAVGPYLLPLTADRIENQRRGTPFWQTLADAGIAATMLRMPTDFPPVECEAHSLAGMSTPDLLGTTGTFSFFTDRPEWRGRKVTGGVVAPVEVKGNRAVLRLNGPMNPLRLSSEPTAVEIAVAIDPENPVARFDVGGRPLVLQQGETSDWVPVRFPLLGGSFVEARGMVRIYAKELRPHLSIYVSPVNLDPRAPEMPISQPKSFARELAAQAGVYYTQGMPYDTAAFRHGVLTRGEYRAHSREVSRQSIALLRAGLDRFRVGLLFFHFFGVDQDAHMLWGRYEDELLETYRMADDALGMVLERAPDATVIVLSDHGFARFDRAVHLNTWLLREGFLRLKRPELGGSAELFANVDWDRTRAYALGLNSLYRNRREDDTSDSLDEIETRLAELRDPANGTRVVTKMVRPKAGTPMAPDLIVGYAPGYRGSWQTALGAVPGVIVEDNTDEWRGDHCIDPDAVPGVLLSNQRIVADSPRLEDLTVTVLEFYGLARGANMKGRTVFR
ncbi:MAG: alkaline phosphatase family protein [Bryobacteraceae bacterium]